MLRPFIIGCAIVSFAAALAAAIWDPASLPMLLIAGLLLVACLFEQRRREVPPPGPGARATDERFVDPETGRVMQVWFDPATGARSYVDAGLPPGPAV